MNLDSARLAAEDRWAISDLLARYCHATDRRDRPALAAMLTPDHVGDLGPAGHYVGRDAVLDAALAVTEKVATQHTVDTSVVVATPEGASGRTSFVARHLREDGAMFTVGGTYFDDFLRSGHDWLIARRRIDVGWAEGDPGVLGLSGDLRGS